MRDSAGLPFCITIPRKTTIAAMIYVSLSNINSFCIVEFSSGWKINGRWGNGNLKYMCIFLLKHLFSLDKLNAQYSNGDFRRKEKKQNNRQKNYLKIFHFL